jgi:formylglycine-generating enzyme required for sulfatase activity
MKKKFVIVLLFSLLLILLFSACVLSSSKPIVKTELTSTLPVITYRTRTPDISITKYPASDLKIGATQTSSFDGMVMVYVPAGNFLMGTVDESGSTYEHTLEHPQHTVYQDGFWIDKTEVTNAMFSQFVESTGYKTEAETGSGGYVWKDLQWWTVEGANWQHPQGPASSIVGIETHPVVQVTWNDANAYCDWAGRRLPTEAEWEKAARGTDGQIYPWGNALPNGNLVNFADSNLDVGWADKSTNDGYQFTAPVGSYPEGVSPYGALDMSGNVYEWVADWYFENNYSNNPTSNPTGPETGEIKILRGGSWSKDRHTIRAAARYLFYPPYSRHDDGGFRCSLSQ